jgi:hypothetical protein
MLCTFGYQCVKNSENKNDIPLFENSEIPLLFHRENSIIHWKASNSVTYSFVRSVMSETLNQ